MKGTDDGFTQLSSRQHAGKIVVLWNATTNLDLAHKSSGHNAVFLDPTVYNGMRWEP